MIYVITKIGSASVHKRRWNLTQTEKSIKPLLAALSSVARPASQQTQICNRYGYYRLTTASSEVNSSETMKPER